MRYVRDTVIDAGDASGDLESSIIDANQLLSISVQSISTDDAEGTLKLQYSNDFAEMQFAPATSVPTNWTDIPSATVAVTAASVVGIPKTDLCYRWIRVVFTNSAGTGELTVNINALSM